MRARASHIVYVECPARQLTFFFALLPLRPFPASQSRSDLRLCRLPLSSTRGGGGVSTSTSTPCPCSYTVSVSPAGEAAQSIWIDAVVSFFLSLSRLLSRLLLQTARSSGIQKTGARRIRRGAPLTRTGHLSLSLQAPTASTDSSHTPPHFTQRQDEIFEPLHERYAPVALDVIRKLRGFYIKLGQIGATRSDFVARQYIERRAGFSLGFLSPLSFPHTLMRSPRTHCRASHHVPPSAGSARSQQVPPSFLRRRRSRIPPSLLSSLFPPPPPIRPKRSCETLQDDCPHEPLSYVRSVISQSLGRPAEEVFEWIEEKPLGSASIGQARARRNSERASLSAAAAGRALIQRRGESAVAPLSFQRAFAEFLQVHKAKLKDGRLVAVKARPATHGLPTQVPTAPHLTIPSTHQPARVSRRCSTRGLRRFSGETSRRSGPSVRRGTPTSSGKRPHLPKQGGLCSSPSLSLQRGPRTGAISARAFLSLPALRGFAPWRLSSVSLMRCSARVPLS